MTHLYRNFFKRLLDLLLAFPAFIILLPVFVLVLLLLYIANNGSIFFTQEWPGKNERLFKVIKFKTMNDRRDDNGDLLPDDMRLTKTGRFVRKTSLDEIPQLINVLKGEMSIVGPRPLLVEYLPLYNSVQKRRHEVRPGITGWAQIKGRNAISWQEKFHHDVWYVDHVSFWLDLKIIFITVLKVLKAEGISSPDAATVRNFTGN